MKLLFERISFFFPFAHFSRLMQHKNGAYFDFYEKKKKGSISSATAEVK